MEWVDWIGNKPPTKRDRPYGSLHFYLDTSALAKLYVEEPGSRELSGWVGERASGFDPEVRVYTSRMTLPEAISAVRRKRDSGMLPVARGSQLWLQIIRDFWEEPAFYQLVEPSLIVVGRAAWLVAQHGLRAYDAVQLASALWLKPRIDDPDDLVFVTADRKLAAAAQAERLATADPTPQAPPPT